LSFGRTLQAMEDKMDTRENSTYSQFTIDGKFQEIAALMDSKFENMLGQIQQLMTPSPVAPSSVAPSPSSFDIPSSFPLETPPRRPIQNADPPTRQDVQHEAANFRHRIHQENPTQSDLPIETTPTVVPFYRRRLSAPTNVDPYRRENTIVRSVADIDPVKSGVLLTSLDLLHVYKWYQDLQKLQKKHPYDQLHWGSFISTAITLRINAFNEAQSYFRRTIMDGLELFLENPELMELILEITLPRTEQEWLEDFKKLVQFKKLKGNQHEIPPDTSRFDEWYMGIMELIYDAREVYEVLSSDPSRNHCPAMKSYSGKAGLMQVFYEIIPMGTGKRIHSQISYVHLDHKDLTFKDYTKRFQEQNQSFQDASDVIKHNRAKMSSPEEKTGMTSVNKSFISNNFNNRNHNNARNNNSSEKQLTPYHNPYQGKLNNLTTSSYFDNYNDDVYINDENINDNYDNDDVLYNIDEVFGGRNESIEGLNPGFNPTQTLSSIDRNTDSIKDSLPCYAELQGKCLDKKTCRYNHDPRLLQRTWSERQEELMRSKYRPTAGPPYRNTPLTPLRSITTEEGGQVSIYDNNNPNENNHHHDRNTTGSQKNRLNALFHDNDVQNMFHQVPVADQQPRRIPELSKEGDDRGQRFL
jgi:hypothetical protein